MHLIWRSKGVKEETVYREEEGCGWRAGEPWIWEAREAGPPLLIMVLLFMQTDTCQKAKGWSNVSGPDDCPWVGGVRHINQSNHSSAHFRSASSGDQGQPAASQPWRISWALFYVLGKGGMECNLEIWMEREEHRWAVWTT